MDDPIFKSWNNKGSDISYEFPGEKDGIQSNVTTRFLNEGSSGFF